MTDTPDATTANILQSRGKSDLKKKIWYLFVPFLGKFILFIFQVFASNGPKFHVHRLISSLESWKLYSLCTKVCICILRRPQKEMTKSPTFFDGDFQSMTCDLFLVAAPATPQPKISPHPQPRATCYFGGRNRNRNFIKFQVWFLFYHLLN